MTNYPGATQRPVPSHGGAMSAHLGLIVHVTTNNGDPYNFFSDPNNQASSTWWASAAGLMEQYVDADLRAWAQAAGNDTYNSVESSGVPSDPLTPAQVESIAQLYAWGVVTYGWPYALAEAPGQAGLGWHGMGGAAWGGHYYCPGDLRKNQRQAILDRAAQINHPSQEDIVASLDDLRAVVGAALKTLHEEHVLILHGDPHHPVSLDSLHAELQALKAQLAAKP